MTEYFNTYPEMEAIRCNITKLNDALYQELKSFEKATGLTVTTIELTHETNGRGQYKSLRTVRAILGPWVIEGEDE